MSRVIAFVAAVVLWGLAIPALAQISVEVSDLDDRPGDFAGETVEIEGEIVGDYGIRDDVVWFQVNDDPYVTAPLGETGELHGSNVGIGVLLPRSLFDESWGSPGSHKTRGPIVRITGIFRYNDPATGGETFVDARAVDLIEHPRPLPTAGFNVLAAMSGVGLAAVGILALAAARFRRKAST